MSYNVSGVSLEGLVIAAACLNFTLFWSQSRTFCSAFVRRFLPTLSHCFDAMAAGRSPLATIAASFEALKDSIEPSDVRAFHSATLDDVRQAAIDIQEAQGKRLSLRNMRRIEPFLLAIEKYSRVVEILCQGTPYLPFIWV